MAGVRVGVDVGGTFTDFVLLVPREAGTPPGSGSTPGEGPRVVTLKLLSTPDRPERAVLEGLRRLLGGLRAEGEEARRKSSGAEGGEGSSLPVVPEAAPGARPEVVHGSTVATNALLERRGSRCAFVTNRGFGDLLALGRQNRPELYHLAPRPEPPLVPPARCFEVGGRVDRDGRELEPLGPEELPGLVEDLRRSGADSVAVCLLFSFLRTEHEDRIASALRENGFNVSISSEILPEFREYERASTTVVNAYVTPVLDRYLGVLERELPAGRLRIMQSSGGSVSAATARRLGVGSVLSGPAGGVVGALHVGRIAGFGRILTLDMGGTSTDVALAEGEPRVTTEARVAGVPVGVPVVDLHTVGSGGGSVARVDAGGALRVGPESAGAEPGPACYGRGGTRPTVTDAHLVLGRLHPGRFLGGRMALDVEAARRALEALAREAGLAGGADAVDAGRAGADGRAGRAGAAEGAGGPDGMEGRDGPGGEGDGDDPDGQGGGGGGDGKAGDPAVAAALGVVRVANATMERALRVISVERGHDPADLVLVAFGGAGGLHALDLARRLGIRRVLVPPAASTLSALGMLAADVVRDHGRTVMLPADVPRARLEGALAPLARRAREDLRGEGIPPGRIRVERSLDMRYRGQSYELSVPWGEDPVARFHELHRRSFGHADRSAPVEVVTVRARGIGRVDPPPLPAAEPGDPDPSAALLGRRPAVLPGPGGRPVRREVPFFDAGALRPGHRLEGPAVVVAADTTVWLGPGDRGEVDRHLNLVLVPGR